MEEGGVLTIRGNSTSSGNTVMAGLAGGAGASDGQAAGSSMFLHNVDATFDIDGTSTISDSIAGIDLPGGGSARVTKSGAGNLVFNGANTYTGGTVIDEGQFTLNGSVASLVTVNAGGTLGGSGMASGGVTVNSGGTVAPGNSIGTLNVAGTYTQASGSTYQVELNPAVSPVAGADNDLIDVTGNAVIDGGTVDVIASGTPDIGTVYTIIQTTGGVSGAGYSAVTDNVLLRDFLLINNADNVQLQATVFSSNFGSVARTFNQTQIGTTLDTINPSATGDMRSVLDDLFLLQVGQQPAAFDQVGGELHATLGIMGVQQTSRLYRLLSSRLSNSPANSNDASAPVVASSGRQFGGVAFRDDDDLIVRGQSCDRCSAREGWIIGYGSGGQFQGDGNAAGLNWSQGGTAFGIHRRMDDETLIGLLGGYGESLARTAVPSQVAEVDHLQLGAYLYREDCRGHYYLLAGSWGYDDYETSRAISFTGTNRTALANYNGQQGSVYLERGWNSRWSCYAIRPQAAVQYTHVRQDDFVETGAGALNLAVDSIEVDSLRGFLGGRLSLDLWNRRDWHVQPYLQANWMHEFGDDTGVFAGRFGAAGSPVFAIRGLDQGRDWALLGTGINISPNNRLSLFASYDLQFNARQSIHVGSGGVQFQW